VICQQDLKDILLNENWAEVVSQLVNEQIGPPILVTPVVIYVAKTGVEAFCQPLEYQINRDG
jgi:hypothetical protein